MNFLLRMFILVLLTPLAVADEIQEADSEALLTPEQIETLLERAQEEAAAEDDDCDNEALLSCIGFERAACEAFRADVIGQCTLPMARAILSSSGEISETLELDHARCTLELVEKNYRVAAKRYLECMPAGTYEDPDAIKNWLNNR